MMCTSVTSAHARFVQAELKRLQRERTGETPDGEPAASQSVEIPTQPMQVGGGGNGRHCNSSFRCAKATRVHAMQVLWMKIFILCFAFGTVWRMVPTAGDWRGGISYQRARDTALLPLDYHTV